MAYININFQDYYKKVQKPYDFVTPGTDINTITDPVVKLGATLEEYYKKILAEEEGDVNRAKNRLMEDYTRGNRINTEDYTRNIAFGQETATAQRAEETLRAGEETGQLEGSLLQRGVSQGGLAEGKRGTLEEKQNLRREAIDRALKKSEEDLQFGKERGMEEETIKQKRGTEDVATQYAKFLADKQQEKGEKQIGLAESEYQREFGKQSTEKSFEFQQKSLDAMKS